MLNSNMSRLWSLTFRDFTPFFVLNLVRAYFLYSSTFILLIRARNLLHTIKKSRTLFSVLWVVVLSLVITLVQRSVPFTTTSPFSSTTFNNILPFLDWGLGSPGTTDGPNLLLASSSMQIRSPAIFALLFLHLALRRKILTFLFHLPGDHIRL